MSLRESRRPSANAMSVDVEDYYHVSAFAGTVPRGEWPALPSRVERNTYRVLELFAESEVTGTFFVLGCVAREHPALVRAIVDQGHELASHGYAHYRVCEQNREEFRKDVLKTRRLLEDIGGVSVGGYRAASFSIDRETWWAFEILAECGYRYSSSINPIRHDHYGIPDGPRFAFVAGKGGFIEIPISTIEIGSWRLPCGGGGFFRLLPYAWSDWCIRRLMASNRPAVFYFHPWEIDPGQPRIAKACLNARLRHYTNLAAMEAKLTKLLGQFAWRPFNSVFLAPRVPEPIT